MSNEDLQWDKLARQRPFDQLTNLRKTSEQWRNGLAALTGTLTTVGILKGVQSFQDLTKAGKWLAFTTLGLAFALLVTASFLAMRAAFSEPDMIINSGEDLKSWTNKEAKKSRRFLFAAQIITPIALICLAAGTVTTWVNKKSEKPQTLVVLLKDGSRLCGTPDQSAGGTVILSLDSEGKQKISIPLTNVQSLQIGKC